MFKKRRKKIGVSNIKAYQHPSRQQHKRNFSVSSRKKKKQKRHKKNKNLYIKKKRNWFIILAPLAFLLVFSLGFFILSSDMFKVEKIIVSNDGFELQDHPIKNLSTEFLQTNIILTNTNSLRKSILNQFPEIQEVKIIKKYPHDLQIDFIEYPKILNIIQESEQGTRKYIVNKQGLITDVNTENSNLPYITLEETTEYQLKEYIFTKEQLDYLMQSIELFESIFDIEVTNIKYISVAREIHLQTEKDFTVWIDTQKQLEDQLQKLERAIPEIDIYNEPIEYIDLRIFSPNGDKVVFKRK